MTNQSGTSAATPTSLGIGEQLRIGRKDRCLSKTWVANQLHLHENMVDALEDERFDCLPAPVFVKGYLRLYAKLLELDEDSLLEPYVLSLGNQIQPMNPQLARGAKRPTIQPSMAGALLLLIALSLTSVWYLKYPKSYAEAPAAPPNQGWSAVRAANAAVASNHDGVQTAQAEASIVFEFLADSWVKVRDDDGQSVLRGMMENGAIRVLSGKPPFDITLGNSAGVKISENGIPYDHTVHVRGNVAHFVLGE